MSGKGRFHIPSIKEMENATDEVPKVKRLFDSHRPNLGKDKPVETSTPVASNPKPISTTSTSTCHNQAASHSTSAFSPSSSSSNLSKPLEKITSNTGSTETTFGDGGKTDENKTSTAESSAATASKSSNSLIVSTRQRGNPILKSVRNVPWEYGDIIPDYVMGQATCCLFLSLRYHALNPNYVHERLKQLGHSYELRVVLVQVDTKDPHFALKELAKVCILSECTLIVAWSPEEAGRYLETYKSYENKPPELIMEKSESDFMSKLTDVVTTVKKVNKTDAITVLSAFGSFDKAVGASEEDLSLCPGFGPQKARRLYSVFNEPFKKSKNLKMSSTISSPVKTRSGPAAISPEKGKDLGQGGQS